MAELEKKTDMAEDLKKALVLFTFKGQMDRCKPQRCSRLPLAPQELREALEAEHARPFLPTFTAFIITANHTAAPDLPGAAVWFIHNLLFVQIQQKTSY